ncbi:MAG: ferredoxin--NADP(+) reductase [Micavibrio aeruginosavorus]|uniref:Ferredoxin--NADP reductase n=1 Tax=Micavibrio aeruginosavorus TaxID=349221 RepID=A0A2W5N5F6_9BACT|nr:MAG: ferredoxin--NADP(+) reductase [Micavibrio aeruginosavorus]
MPHEPIETDVIIIGAGPSGLFAVFECGMLGLKCAVFDSLPEIGGQCTALYPEKPIYDIPGCPEILAGNLIHNLEKQAASFGPSYHLGQQIVSLSNNNGFWQIETSKAVRAKAMAIIIAAGGGAFGPNRPPLEGIEKFENSPAGNGVQYMVRRKDDYAGKRVVIAGGGDSAVDWALSLAPIAKSVQIVHRRPKFRAAAESVRQLEALASQGKVELVVPYQLKDLRGRDGFLTEIIVYDEASNENRTLEADVLLPFFGLAAELGPIADWSLSLSHNHISVDAGTCETSQAGIYAIGDIAAYRNKLKLILTGFNEAALAAHAIRARLRPDEPLHFEYSTTKGLPGAA